MKRSAAAPAVGRTIRCPACGGPSRYAGDNPHRPFCSERCRNLDLGAWASGSYRVPSPPSTGEDGPDADGSDSAH